MDPSVKHGLLKRSWSRLNRPSTKYSVLAIASLFFVAGILAWGGFHTGIHYKDPDE
jgi:nitrate/TMAO reductase-like tetraheme cytochrome c subunit